MTKKINEGVESSDSSGTELTQLVEAPGADPAAEANPSKDAQSSDELLAIVERALHSRKGIASCGPPLPSDQSGSDGNTQYIRPLSEERNTEEMSRNAAPPAEAPLQEALPVRQLTVRPAPMLGINSPRVDVLEQGDSFSVNAPDNSFTITGDAQIIRRLKRILFI